MAWWMYKCRWNQRENQRTWGDWKDFFADNDSGEWGSTEEIPALKQLSKGDFVLAYQTDRNELVGLAQVLPWQKDELWLKPRAEIHVKVRPLKARPEIARIRALQQGPIQTVYAMTEREAKTLLQAAGMGRSVVEGLHSTAQAKRPSGGGASFGEPEHNVVVERKAVRLVTRDLERTGWSATDISRENCGYDLEATKGRSARHVEVKGIRGSMPQFIITEGERRAWEDNPRFELAVVTGALTKRPKINVFKGRPSLRRFTLSPISYTVRLRG